MRAIRGLVVICIFLMLSCSSYALVFTKVNFGTVEPGQSIDRESQVGGDVRDNTYIITAEGELADWIEISNDRVTVPAQRTEKIKVRLNVPEDAPGGDYTGYLVARAVDPIDGGNIGITLQVKAKMTAQIDSDIPKPVAEEPEGDRELAPGFLDIESMSARPNPASQGEEVRIDTEIINTGNETISGTLFVEIKKEGFNKKLSKSANSLKPGERKTVDLYLETKELELGEYSIYAYTQSEGEDHDEYGPMKFLIEKKQRSATDSDIFWGALIFLLFLLLLMILHEAYKKNENKIKKYFENIKKGSKKKKTLPEPKKEETHSLKSLRERIEDMQNKIDEISENDKKYQEIIDQKEEEITQLREMLNEFAQELDSGNAEDEYDILKDYIKEAIGKGFSSEEIEERLVSHGWDEKKVNKAFKKIVDEMR